MMVVDEPKPETGNPKRPARKSGVVVPNAPRWYQRLGAWVIYAAACAHGMTLRMRWDNRTGYSIDQLGGPAIYCIWHNRLALCMEVYHRETKLRSHGKGLAALI